MIKINKQLRKYFILVSSMSIIFVTVISNISIYMLFSNYIKDMRVKGDAKVVQYVENEYTMYRGLNYQSKMSIMHYALSENVTIIIQDGAGVILYNSSSEDSMFNLPITEKSTVEMEYKGYFFSYDGKLQGTVYVGRPKSILSNFEDKRFLSTINVVFVLSFVFSLAIAIFLSTRISGKFLNPIHAIKENAKLIEAGRYKKLIEVDTNTYELYDLSKSVKELSDKLDLQESLRKRMTNDLAHELRTPIATIQSHIEAFMDGIWTPDIQKLSIIQVETDRLMKLINELADLAVVENDKIKLNKTNVDLSCMLNDLMLSLEPVFMGKNIDAAQNIQEGVYFLGDEDKLRRIFINIISNAIKYSNENGNISVLLQRAGDSITFSVEDTGIGISKEDLKHVFERFYRSDVSRSRKTGGMGIGLTLTKALTEAHGGSINILSEQGKGTSVIVKFTVQSAGNICIM